MTSQSGGGGGYPGVTSDNIDGLLIAGPLTAGDSAADLVPTFHKLQGSTSFPDVAGSNVDEDAPVVVLQTHAVPSDGSGPSAVFITRLGDISAQDYAQAEVIITDSTASTQPILQVLKQGTAVLELTTRKSITGALASVTDANAKAVLTSIIAALTDIKVATDNTT